MGRLGLGLRLGSEPHGVGRLGSEPRVGAGVGYLRGVFLVRNGLRRSCLRGVGVYLL